MSSVRPSNSGCTWIVGRALLARNFTDNDVSLNHLYEQFFLIKKLANQSAR